MTESEQQFLFGLAGLLRRHGVTIEQHTSYDRSHYSEHWSFEGKDFDLDIWDVGQWLSEQEGCRRPCPAWLSNVRNATRTDTHSDLCVPWSLHFGRDGTEDFGVILDANGDGIASSQQCRTCWLPEREEDETPALVHQLRLMAAAPALLGMLKTAVAASDPAKHSWVEEARQVLAEATGCRCEPDEAGPAKATRPKGLLSRVVAGLPHWRRN